MWLTLNFADHQSPVAINFDQILYMVDGARGAQLMPVTGSPIMVLESVEDILAMVAERTGAS